MTFKYKNAIIYNYINKFILNCPYDIIFQIVFRKNLLITQADNCRKNQQT